MNKRIALLIALATISLAAVAGDKLANPALGKVRHVVLYAYKADVTPEKQAEIAQSSRDLIKHIELIKDLEWGADLNAGARSQGYTHCLLMTFDSQEAVKEYIAHPAHQAFVELAKPHLEKLMVVDYVAAE